MLLPVIRGKIGNWRYYTGLMTFKQVAEYITPSIGELYQAKCLDELLQRELTTNYEAIRDYILKDGERFFNALILAIYDGDPQWLEAEFENESFTNVGFLSFSGNENIFPVDGQHRVAGIKAAIEGNDALSSETIPVVFIAHTQSDEGRKRTRKLFSTLNRRAKPVGQNENIALDEDDACAIITRMLLNDFELFKNDNVVNGKGKQIPNNNEKAFTSLIALYQCVCTVVQKRLGLSSRKFKEFQLFRPSEETIVELSTFTCEVFDSFVNHTDVVKDYLLNAAENKAALFRNKNGGNILFRPMVLTDYFEVAMALVQQGMSSDDAFVELNSIPQDLGKEPWVRLLWDGEKIVNRLSHTTLKDLLLLMACPELLSEASYQKLINAYAKGTSLERIEAERILEENRKKDKQ